MSNYSQLLKKEANKNVHIFWDIPEESITVLSNQALIERLLNYGDIDQLKAILSNLTEFKKIYSKMQSKKRQNLFPEVINLINVVLEYNAQRNTK